MVRRDASNGVAHGDLTLAGITRPVELQIPVNKIGRNQITEEVTIGVTGTVVVKRSQFGLDAYSDLVADDLTIKVQIEGAVGPDRNAPRSDAATVISK